MELKLEQGMRCYFINQIYTKNIWVLLNSETPDSRTEDFLKMGCFLELGFLRDSFSQWSLSSIMATSHGRRERINLEVFSSLCWEGPNSRKPLIYIHNCCIFYKYM